MTLPQRPFKEQVGDANDLEQLDVRSKGQKMKRLASEVTLTKKRQGRIPLIKRDNFKGRRCLTRVDISQMGIPEGSKAMDLLSVERNPMSAHNSILNPLNKRKNKLTNKARF